MTGSYLSNPLNFLISTLFDLYILAVMLRFLFQLVRADFYNPVSQFLVKITSPVLIPLRRMIPGIGGIDVAAIVLMLLLVLVKLVILSLITGNGLHAGLLAILSVSELVDLTFNVFIFAILIQVIISWINPQSYNPVTGILHQLTEPVLRPARRLIPPMSGFDLSPLVAMLALQVIRMLVMPMFNQLARLML